MRFSPCSDAVENMRNGDEPDIAALKSILKIREKYPGFSGAIVALNKKGKVNQKK